MDETKETTEMHEGAAAEPTSAGDATEIATEDNAAGTDLGGVEPEETEPLSAGPAVSGIPASKVVSKKAAKKTVKIKSAPRSGAVKKSAVKKAVAKAVKSAPVAAAAKSAGTKSVNTKSAAKKFAKKAPPKKAVAAKASPAKVIGKAKSPVKTAAPAPAKSASAPAKPAKPAKVKEKKQPKPEAQTAKVLESKLAFEGPLFRVMRDHIIEPNGRETHRDVIRHNGSAVILAVNPGKKKKDPWIVIERQYRHAAGQYLWELPAGKMDEGEDALAGAIRELAEETGYQANKWSMLLEYFASPGFLGEAMKVFLAEGLIAGDAHPEEDEHIDFRLVKLSDLLEMIDKGKILDGKTLVSVLLYARMIGLKRKK